MALLLVLGSNVPKESRRGYERMTAAEARLDFNWDFSMHLARIAALMLVTFFVRFGLVAVLALALSYVEIYPMAHRASWAAIAPWKTATRPGAAIEPGAFVFRGPRHLTAPGL